MLRGWKFDQAVLCSVVPKKGAFLRDELGAKPLHNVDHHSKLGVGVDYPQLCLWLLAQARLDRG